MEKKEIRLTDRVSDFEGESSRTYTPEGYLRVKGRVARSGIQSYYGFELGLKDGAYMRKKVYRPEDVVLSDSVCALFDGADVTLGHPKQFVDAKSYRTLSSGVVIGKARRDETNPEFIVCDMLIKDEGTIKAIEAGRVGLSVGYSSTLDLAPGTTPDGEHYDARVDSISRVNHVALVDRPRAGFEARVLDAEGGAMKTINIADQAVELQDEVADLIAKHLKAADDRAEAAEKAVQLKDEQCGSLTAQIEELKSDLEAAKSAILTDEDIQAVLKTADGIRSDARVIAGDTFVCDSLDPQTIMLAALKASGSQIDFTDADDGFVKGVFTYAVETAKKGRECRMNDSQTTVAKAMLDGENKTSEKTEKTADQIYKERVSEAWKAPVRQ